MIIPQPLLPPFSFHYPLVRVVCSSINYGVVAKKVHNFAIRYHGPTCNRPFAHTSQCTDSDGKPLPPLPLYPYEQEPASPVYSNPDEDQEYYEPTEMSGYPETYRPALSTITEQTERSEYSRQYSASRRNVISGYTNSQSFTTEYHGQPYGTNNVSYRKS